MSLNLDSFKNNLPSILNTNPNIKNSILSEVVSANIIKFKGHVQISDREIHSFHSDGYEGTRKPAKIIYISPYGFWIDLLVSIKRIFAGVVFSHSSANGDLRVYLAQGRRVTIFCALDGSEAEALIETDKQPLFPRIYRAIFSRG